MNCRHCGARLAPDDLVCGNCGNIVDTAPSAPTVAVKPIPRTPPARTRRISATTVLILVFACGFVGLIVPHAARFLFGPDHRLLLPACALLGSAGLVLADALSRTLLAPTEVPVGVLTVLVGGPAFILLYRHHRWEVSLD